MGESNIKPLKYPRKLWLVPMVLLLAQQSHALGLGEMRIQSYLGEPLRAQVDLTDLGGDYESSLKVRLASPEEYRKAGIAYPYEKKYSFVVVNEDGRHPRVKVSSLRAIEDPFLNILIEVISPTGLIIKTYTVLVDPSPDYYRNQTVAQTVMPTAVSSVTAAPVELAKPAPVVATQGAVVAVKEASSPRKPKVRKSHVASSIDRRTPASPRARYRAPQENGEPVFGKLSLSLSTSLSISSNDPTLPLNPKEANDALQEELIAKEKTLKELNDQIAEMQTLIKGLQIKLSMTASSAVSASGVMEESAVPVISQVEPVSAVSAESQVIVAAIETPIATPQPSMLDLLMAWLEDTGNKLLAGLAVIAMGVGGYYWWRKRKLERGWVPGGLFDDLAGPSTVELSKPVAPAAVPVEKVAAAPAPAATNKVAVQKLAVGEQSMKVPAYKEQKAPSTLPPEYDLLEEANIYLRFGHDKLAEEVLHDALKINPKNPDIYMSLLGIFETRTDAQGFEKLAKEFKVIADEQAWNKVAEMGRKLDIGNSLYD